MDFEEMKHYGVLNMKWGIRRFRNKDGSLTALGKKRRKEERAEETAEERRARALKSTNAAEIYKERDLLTTNEINERLNRINAEARLKELSDSTKKTGMDRIDKALKVGRKVNEIYEFMNTPVMKSLKKKFGIEKDDEPKRLSLKEVYAKRNKLSDKVLSDALKRANTEKTIKKMLDEEESERKKNQTTNDSKPNDSKPKNNESATDDSTTQNSTKPKEKKSKSRDAYDFTERVIDEYLPKDWGEIVVDALDSSGLTTVGQAYVTELLEQ